MRIFIGEGLMNRFRKALPPDVSRNRWMAGIPVFTHAAYPFTNDDGDTVIGCVFLDSGRTVLLVEKGVPFTTA